MLDNTLKPRQSMNNGFVLKHASIYKIPWSEGIILSYSSPPPSFLGQPCPLMNTLGCYHAHCPRIFSIIIGQNPSVSKANRVDDALFRVSLLI